MIVHGFRRKRKLLAIFMILFPILFVSCNDGGSSSDNIHPPFMSTSWSIADLIDPDRGGVSNPQIVIDGTGTAIAIWLKGYSVLSANFPQTEIWTNRFDGIAWGTAELIETSVDEWILDLQLVTDGAGTAIAIWRQGIDDFSGPNSGHYDIWAKWFDGDGWGAAELIETDNGNVSNLRVAMDGSGTAIAVWRQDGDTAWNIWAKRFDGAAWETAELIGTDDASNASYPQIAMDGTGAAIAVWGQYDGTAWNLWAKQFDGAAWGTAELIETGYAGYDSYPQIAMDSTGAAIAVWRQSGDAWNLWANRFDGATWGTAELIETGDGDVSDPQIAMDDNGAVIAIWRQNDGTNLNLWANRFNGAAWGTAELIETGNAGWAEAPQIAMDGTGAAIAVWTQSDGDNTYCWTNRFDGIAWGTAEWIPINSDGSFVNLTNASDPQIVMDDTGTAIAVWTQYGENNRNVWTSRYE